MIRKFYIIKIQDSYLAELLYWWIQYDKPCKLIFIKAKSDGLTGIKIVVESLESDNFIQKAKLATGLKLLETDENYNLLENQRP